MDIRFVRPVRENDWVVAGGDRGDGRLVYQVWVRAERTEGRETVISGTITLGDRQMANPIQRKRYDQA